MRKVPFTPELEAKLHKLLAQGLTYDIIRMRLGVSERTLSAKMREIKNERRTSSETQHDLRQ